MLDVNPNKCLSHVKNYGVDNQIYPEKIRSITSAPNWGEKP